MITVCIPHLNTPELLEASVRLWKAQTVKPEVWVVDTGSKKPPTEARKFGAFVCEVPRCTPAHPLEPIAWACSAAMLRCKTPFVFFTHVDVFPKRRDLLESFLGWMQATSSAVAGYHTWPRDHWPLDWWRGMVGHSLTMADARVLRANGVRWGYQEAVKKFGVFGERDAKHWDPEMTFNLHLRRAGLPILLLGQEAVHELVDDEWHVHLKGYPSARRFKGFFPELEKRSEEWRDRFLPEALARAEEWESA